MQRDPEALGDGEFDVLVIGGGVLGACVARDAAMRGLRTALVERDDFGSGASANSLKLVHGGVRHLQRLDVAQARRSARERAAWLAVAPHLVRPLEVLVPTFPGRFPPLALLRAAVVAHQRVIATPRPTPRRVEVRVHLSRDECIRIVPELAETNTDGGVLFEDALIHNAERLVLEVVLGAVSAGAVAVNHVEVLEPLRRSGRLEAIRVRNRLTNDEMEVRARRIVNAAGAWAPAIARRLTGRPGAMVECHALAFNAVVAGPTPGVAFSALAPPPGGRFGRFGGKRYFIVPWRGRTLVGTGYVPFRGDPAGFRPETAPVESLFDELARTAPAFRWSPDDVRRVHGGLLPAARDTGSTSVALRHHDRVVRHAVDGAPELFTAVAVKLTTARALAEAVVDAVFHSMGHAPPPCHTAETPLPGATTDLRAVRSAIRQTFGGPEDVVEHLARTYGSRASEVAAAGATHSDGWTRVTPIAPVIRAEWYHAIRSEMAVTPEDLLERRTELGAIGAVDDDARRAAAEVLASAGDANRPGAPAGAHGC